MRASYNMHMTFRGLVPRDENGVPAPNAFRVDPARGELWISDGTGFVSGTDPTAEIVDASPVKYGRLNRMGSEGIAERAAATNGKLVIEVPGDYEIMGQGIWVGTGAADVITIAVLVNGSAIADAAGTPGGPITLTYVMVGTETTQWVLSGGIPGLKVGDYVQLAVTGTGSTTVTIKNMRVVLKQVSDEDPALQE